MPESNVSSAFATTPSNPNLMPPAPENTQTPPPVGDAPAGGAPAPSGGDGVDLNALLASLGGGTANNPANNPGGFGGAPADDDDIPF